MSVLSRLWAYSREMYPLEVYVPFSFAGFFGFTFFLQALAGVHPLHVSGRAIAGALLLSAFSLLMRLFDELKDVEADKTLFPDRPLPSGKVKLADLQGLAWILGGGMTAIAIAQGVLPLLGFGLLLAYGLLTFRYFFVPHWHKDNLLLTVATHNPVVVFCNLYVWTVFLADQGLPLRWPSPAVWAGILMFWFPVLAWEVSRKIKAPESENAYITYSKILGPRRAAAVPMGLLSVSLVLALYFGGRFGLPGPILGAIAAAYAYAMGGFLRWQWRVVPAHARLKPFVEAFSLGLYLALLIGFCWRFGAVWTG